MTGFLVSAGPFALLLVFLIVFVENGLLFPFLPGDSLVFAASMLAASLGIHWLVVAAVAGASAALGAELGFRIGRRRGRQLFSPGARVFRTTYLDEADAFFARYGRFAVVVGRFVPIVRTFMSPAIGISTMSHRQFSTWNVIGAFAWSFGLVLLGSFLGGIAWVSSNVDVLMLIVVAVSLIPIAVAALARRRRDQNPQVAP